MTPIEPAPVFSRCAKRLETLGSITPTPHDSTGPTPTGQLSMTQQDCP